MKIDLDSLIRERQDQVQQLLGEIRLLTAMKNSSCTLTQPEPPQAADVVESSGEAEGGGEG